MKDLSKTINDHGKKMVSVAKMKCNQREKDRNEREKDRSYAMQLRFVHHFAVLGREEADDDSNASREGEKK